jgi:hypothetical protein
MDTQFKADNPGGLFTKLTARKVLPEILDSLPPEDIAAQRSRKELRWINSIMGNHRWICRVLASRIGPEMRLLELGAGDGMLARRAWMAGVLPPNQWTALDLSPAPQDWPCEAVWRQADLFSLESLPDAEVVVANLFLHHFEDVQLGVLATRLPANCRLFVACEPARRRRHLLQGQLLSSLARLSAVTHHDMLVSIRAGFMGNELVQALGMLGWHSKVELTALGAYRMIAWR